MAYDDINNRYSKSFDATRAQLEANKKSKMNDLQNQEADINNKYTQLLDTYNASKAQNQKHFYEQRNAADVANAKDTRRMNELALARGWRGGTLAQINLDQNTQRSNALGAINSDENKFLSDLAMQQLNAKRDNTTALSQLTNNRNLTNEQYNLGLYGAQQENEFKKLAEIYAAQQDEKKRQWDAQQQELQRAFQKQQQSEQLTSQKDIANMEYNYKNTKDAKTDENDQLKAVNQYYDDILSRFDKMSSMNQKEYRDGDNNIVNKDIDVATKKYIYNYIKNDSNLTSGQRQELMARYNLNKDMYLLEPQQQDQFQMPLQPQNKSNPISSSSNSLWDEVLKKILPWWR